MFNGLMTRYHISRDLVPDAQLAALARLAGAYLLLAYSGKDAG
jgi:hypothetical protein